MPGGDGTGPMGLGPMTGGGRGYCAVPLLGSGARSSVFCRGFFGRVRGRGRGLGRGFGFRGAVYPYAYGNPAFYDSGYYPYAPDLTPQQEANMLKEQAKTMQEEIKAINERISELASAAKKDK